MSTPTTPKASAPSGSMPNHRVLTYALDDVANNLSFMMTSMFLMVYMTDIVGLSAGVAGAIYGVTKIWAGSADLIAGNVVDRTHSRRGRLRPYLIFGPAPLAVFFVALFSTPAGLSGVAAIAWIFLFDALFQLAYSFVNIPYGSLASAMTQDPVDRSKLSGSRAIASSLASVALAWVVAPQFEDTQVDGIRLQFMITCVILAVIAIVLYLICFANSREVVPRTAGAISFRQTFTMLRRNRPLQILLLTALLFLTSNSVFNPVVLYYVRAITGNAGYFAFLQLAQTLGMIFFASFAPAITRRYGKRNGCMLAALVSVLFYRLDGATHLQVVEELTERRTQHAIAGAKGVDVERTQVGEAGLGDGRTRLMRRPGTPNPPIVTIFGQRGSGATEISPMVAELLQVPYIGQKFSSQTLAQADRTTLVSDSAFNRWMRNRSHSGSRNTDMAVALDTAPNHQIAEENTKSVLADAENGAVLLGRNGALVLGPVVGTLHVRLIAPLDKRIERVMHKTGLSASEAAEQCEIEDRLRAEMSRKLYKWDPNVDEEYDLVINTASTTYKQVAELIVEMYRSKYPENVPPRNQTGD